MPLLGVLAVFLLLVAGQGLVYARFWRRGLDVSLSFSERTAPEGASISLTEVVASRKLLPLPWLTVKFQVSRALGFEDSPHGLVTDDYYREDLYALGTYQRVTRTLRVDLRRRGYYTVKTVDLISNDLFLMTELVGRVDCPATLTVTPRPIAREDLGIPYSRLVGTLIVRDALLPDPFEFRGIREYAATDPMRSVNWKATARTGDLKVNVHEYTASRDVLLLLNVRKDREHDEDRPVEDCIRIAAALCAALVEDGVSVGLASNARDIVTGEEAAFAPGRTRAHVDAVHEQLGRVDIARRTADFAQVLESGALDLRRRPMLLLISASCTHRLSEAWKALLAEGHQGIWVLPRYPDRPDDRRPELDEGVATWEVAAR